MQGLPLYIKDMVSPFWGLEDRVEGAGGAPASRRTAWPAAQLAGGVGGGGCCSPSGSDSMASSASESALVTEWLSDVDTEVSEESTWRKSPAGGGLVALSPWGSEGMGAVGMGPAAGEGVGRRVVSAPISGEGAEGVGADGGDPAAA